MRILAGTHAAAAASMHDKQYVNRIHRHVNQQLTPSYWHHKEHPLIHNSAHPSKSPTCCVIVTHSHDTHMTELQAYALQLVAWHLNITVAMLLKHIAPGCQIVQQ